MAYLEFTGKRFVQNYHLTVPHRKLEIDKKKSLTDKPGLEDNIIVHGDNLEALKSLMPHFAGKVKCIYIDPPYNTGNEGWVYNDNVKYPDGRDWFGKPVETQDANRHDKWLCMMTPRLKLLRELMSEDGVIFISIDDNENHRLRMLMDDIFGENQFVAELIVQSNPKGRVLQPNFATSHEYVLCYSLTENDHAFAIEKSEEQIEKEYPEIDEKGRYRWLELRNTHREFNPQNRKNLWYPIFADIKTGEVTLSKNKGSKEVWPLFEDQSEGVWTWGKEKVGKHIDQLKAWQTGADWKIFRKARVGKKKLKSLLIDPSFATEKGMLSIEAIFGGRPFQNPKSPYLLATLFEAATEPGDLVLDSFAGSGTTAQAVLALNKDGGNRKFILVQCDEINSATGKQIDISDKITAERVRRVIKGVKTAKDENLKKGLGGSFTYYELGEAFDEEKFLSGKNLPSYKDMAGFVWSTLTGASIDEKKIKEKKQYIGETDKFEVYLIYEPDLERLKKDVALTFDWLKKLPEWNGTKKRLVFAPVKWMSSDVLHPFGVEYVQLPYEIYRRIEPK